MADAGSLILGGAENLAQGMNNYSQLQQQDATATGQINAFLQAAKQNPAAMSQLSPAAQSLLDKQMTGKANMKDRLQLLGEMTASQKIQQTQSDLALQAAQASNMTGEASLNSARAAQIQRQMQWLQGIMGGPGGTPSSMAMNAYAQPVGGTGTPAPMGKTQGILQPPDPVQITDPQIQAQLPQALRMTLGDPDKANDMLQKMVDAKNAQRTATYQAQANAIKPTGNFYFKRLDYKDGAPQTDVYSPEIVTGMGTASQSMAAGPNEISVPHGQKPPGPVVTPGTAAVPDNTVAGAGYNTNDPAWQSEVADAYNKAASSSVALANAKALQDAATAYTSGNMSQFNAIRGDPKYSKLFSVFTGTNPAAAFKIALAANTQSVLNEIRGPNGSVGGRILQNEYDNTSKVLADSTMDNPSIMAAAQNNYTLADRRNNIDQAVAMLRETMPLGQATAMATKMFGLTTPNIQTGLSVQGQASAQAAAPAANGMAKVKSPQGVVGSIPQANLASALKQGYTPAN
jgi:hypothetical protein